MKKKNYVSPCTKLVVTKLYKNFLQDFNAGNASTGNPANARAKERNSWEENYPEEVTTEMSLW
ncbi:MAG: hypothetical protein IKN83_06800 [Bacteroidaceae bacterium]|nr:hypothetical protein [Bacteroidaceae bacterium]